jgi:hypothetical protein
MKRVIFSALVIAVLLAVSTPAYAQQTRKTAITMAGSSSIGLLIHATDSVAVRPEFSFLRSTSESSGFTTSKTTTWTLGTGVSGLFYVAKWDGLRAYLSPRFSWSRAKSTSSTSTATSSPSNAYGISGSVGLQYGLGDRFMVFGESGLNYGWSKSTISSITQSTLESRVISTRSVVGVGFYF